MARVRAGGPSAIPGGLVEDRAAALRGLRPHPAVLPSDGRVPAEGSLLAVSGGGAGTGGSRMRWSSTAISSGSERKRISGRNMSSSRTSLICRTMDSIDR